MPLVINVSEGDFLLEKKYTQRWLRVISYVDKRECKALACT